MVPVGRGLLQSAAVLPQHLDALRGVRECCCGAGQVLGRAPCTLGIRLSSCPYLQRSRFLCVPAASRTFWVLGPSR